MVLTSESNIDSTSFLKKVILFQLLPLIGFLFFLVFANQSKNLIAFSLGCASWFGPATLAIALLVGIHIFSMTSNYSKLALLLSVELFKLTVSFAILVLMLLILDNDQYRMLIYGYIASVAFGWILLAIPFLLI